MKVKKPIIFITGKKLTYSEELIIDFINSHKGNVFNFSQKELAKKTFTSEPTISRLIKKLNYKNYKDFLIKINYLISNMNKKYPIYKEDNNIHIAKNIINSHLYAVADGMDINVINNLEQLSERIIKQKGFLLIFGIGSSNRVAQELTTNFQRIRIRCISDSDFHRMLPIVNSANKNDTLILFSNKALNKEIAFITKVAMNNGVYVVLITTNGNPMVRPSKIIHYKRIHADSYEVPVSSKTIQNIMGDVLFRMTLSKKPSLKRELRKSLKILDDWTNN